MGPVRVDMPKVKARKDAIVRRSSTAVEGWLRTTDNLTICEGHGRFESPRTVRVGDDLLEAGKIFINVGGRARVPDLSGLDTVDCLTNSTMMEVDVLPEHLIIVGGSYIGLEFAQSKYPPAEPGALVVSRSKRPETWPRGGHLSHPTGGYFASKRSWSCRRSSRSCSWMYVRMACSSRPTVDTK